MKFRRLSRYRIWLAAGGVVAIAVAITAASGRIRTQLERSINRCKVKVGQQLVCKGVVAYWSFDDSPIEEAVSRGVNFTKGTCMEGGHFGRARRFIAGQQGSVESSVPVGAIGKRYTASCWLKFHEIMAHQTVFDLLHVHDGKLTVMLSDQETLTCPVPVTDRFFHVAYTVDEEARRAQLYVDGTLKDERQFKGLVRHVYDVRFGQSKWQPPCSFTLDEVAIWNRLLPGQEIAKLWRARVPLNVRHAFVSLGKQAVLEGLQSGLHSFLLAADLFNPCIGGSRVYASGFPRARLGMSPSDIRAFKKYHNRRCREGLNEPYAVSDKRRVKFDDADGEYEAQAMVVDDPARMYSSYKRKTFLVATRADEGRPARRMLFQPLENTPFMLALTAAELARQYGYPLAPPRLYALDVNTTFEGLYLARSLTGFEGPGGSADEETWKACLARLPVSRREALEVFDAILARHRAALLSDRKCPMTTRELLDAVAAQRRMIEDVLSGKPREPDAATLAARVGDYLQPGLFIGGNPAACLVVKDLDLSRRSLPGGVTLTCRSLTPAVVSDDGRITAAADHSTTATVEVAVRTATGEMTKPLSFRVLPACRKVPVVRVDVVAPVDAEHDSPCTVDYLGKADEASTRVAGLVRYRGNTALVKAQKKYYHLKLDTRLGVGDIAPTRRWLLTSSYRDPTFMRDKLSYDVFRSFSEPGKPRYAAHVEFVELVVRNEYMGLYGLSERLDAETLGLKTPQPDNPWTSVLYKSVGAQASFTRLGHGNYLQEEPDWKTSVCWGPYESLIRLVGGSDNAYFREHVDEAIDIGNIMDFEILLLLTNNREGRNFNLYIARDRGPGARFFLVPWDYDMTYRSAGFISNGLIDRLHHQVPGYTRRMQDRWKSLRQDRLSEPVLMGRMDGIDATIKESVGRNFEHWPLFQERSHDQHVAELRDWIRRRLVQVDHYVDGLKDAGGTDAPEVLPSRGQTPEAR